MIGVDVQAATAHKATRTRTTILTSTISVVEESGNVGFEDGSTVGVEDCRIVGVEVTGSAENKYLNCKQNHATYTTA